MLLAVACNKVLSLTSLPLWHYVMNMKTQHPKYIVWWGSETSSGQLKWRQNYRQISIELCHFDTIRNRKLCFASHGPPDILHGLVPATVLPWVYLVFKNRDVILKTMESQITGVPIVYHAVCSGADPRKHQSPASLASVRETTADSCIPLTKGQQRGKCFHLMTSSCIRNSSALGLIQRGDTDIVNATFNSCQGTKLLNVQNTRISGLW